MAALRRHEDVLDQLAEQYTAGNLTPETYELRVETALHAPEDATAVTWDLPALRRGLVDRFRTRIARDHACTRLYFDVPGLDFLDLTAGPHTWTIGRSSKNDVVLTDSLISRTHALVSTRGGRCTIRDLGSRHGLFVNDRRIAVATLHPGDVVSFAGAVTAQVR